MYWLIKASLLIYMIHPRLNGAVVLYQEFLKPILVKQEVVIDGKLQNVQDRVKTFFQKSE